MRNRVTLVFAWVVFIATGLGVARAETIPAVVAGADSLYVRRGPGTDFPAFAALEKGERVEVDQLEGVWARVRLASGQQGYVHSTFLAFPGQPPATVLVVTARPATPRPTPTSTPDASEEGAQLRIRNTELEEEVRYLRAKLQAPQASREGHEPPSSAPSNPPVQNDIQRLAAAVEALQQRLDQPQPHPASPQGTLPEGEHAWSSPAIGLFMLMALLVGWVAGAVYGRHTERSRRTRIRF